jgi:BirA family biotin operon repressor/biotin-[acetyl-CoA-carboxylase] ligase
MDSFSEEIAKTATSLRMEMGKTLKRSTLIAEIMRRFEQDYEEYVKTGDLSGIREAYERLMVNYGKEVRILGAQEPFQALALGINNNGELLVRKEDGSEEAVYAGEVSVRGVYGYV